MTIIPVPPTRRKPDFTLTMINIVFLLLLFFLTTGSLTNRNEAQSEVPFTENLPLERLPRPLLQMARDGGLYLDGRKLERGDLVPSVRAVLAKMDPADAHLNILAERDMQASAFLDIADLLRAAGIELRIVTVRQQQGAAAP
jgi:biopolymer transport protein ExbD